MMKPSLKTNDAKAKKLIVIFSIIVFMAISVLGRYNLAGQVSLPFDVHIFATINAVCNALVTVLLSVALVFVNRGNVVAHRNVMLLAMGLSILFLLSYVCHHLFASEAIYGDIDGVPGLSDAERETVGSSRTLYLIILITHIPLAGIALPFILFTAYRGLSGSYEKHKKMARIVWPLWLYVAVTGVLIYWMIKPYYAG